MKLGIAFAGGGLKGIAYIGVFKALEELGIKPDYEIKLNDEYANNPTKENDNQLQKAIDLLK